MLILSFGCALNSFCYLTSKLFSKSSVEKYINIIITIVCIHQPPNLDLAILHARWINTDAVNIYAF